MNKTEATQMLHDHMQNINLRRHSYAVAYTLVGIYDYLKSQGILESDAPSRDQWEVLGILHDSDYEITKDEWEKHTILTQEWLQKAGMAKNDPIYLAMMSHNNKHTNQREPQTQMEWALETCDELTGFIVATALILPGKKLAAVELSSIKKKWKQPSFAKGVDRTQTELCEKALGIPLDEFMQIVLRAMQTHSEELGL